MPHDPVCGARSFDPPSRPLRCASAPKWARGTGPVTAKSSGRNPAPSASDYGSSV